MDYTNCLKTISIGSLQRSKMPFRLSSLVVAREQLVHLTENISRGFHDSTFNSINYRIGKGSRPNERRRPFLLRKSFIFVKLLNLSIDFFFFFFFKTQFSVFLRLAERKCGNRVSRLFVKLSFFPVSNMKEFRYEFYRSFLLFFI
jgi:hypothetical protein